MNIVSRGTVTTMEIKGGCSIKDASPRVESNPVARKRRMDELPLSKIPKAPRRESKDDECTISSSSESFNELTSTSSAEMLPHSHCAVSNRENSASEITEDDEEYIQRNGKDLTIVKNKPPIHPDIPHKRLISVNRRDDSTRLRKTIQWLEEGARKLREDLADVRAELHDEKKSAKIARRETERAVKKARNQEARKYQNIIADLRARLPQYPFKVSLDSSSSIKSEQSKDANQKCEIIVARKRRAELKTITNLNSDSLDSDDCTKRKRKYSNEAELRTIESEIPNSQKVNEELKGNLQMDLCKGDCEEEIERLRQYIFDQQKIIERFRQALKERDRKLDQLWNKKRKEKYYKKWSDLEPVVEVDNEEEQEDGDNALISSSSSLSKQPGTYGWQANTVTREAYEALLFEIDELHNKYTDERQELLRTRNHVRDLEVALLQESQSVQTYKIALSNKLREAEEREAGFIAELSELKEQNELLEFRVIELEEIGPRDNHDTVDSGIVSPEPIQLFKISGSNKQKDRAIATVIPYSSCNSQSTLLLTSAKKSSLSLEESGIFEDEYESIEVSSCGTQTEAPAGELLQEVQRLQVLRERIQEKAAKVPISPEIFEITEERLNLYKDKVRELEEQLAMHEENAKKRLDESFTAKQKEEDLMNENCRLTTKIYWLENELRNLRDLKSTTKINVGTMTRIDLKDSCTMTESTIKCAECETIKKEYDEKAEKLDKAEDYFHHQLIDLERKKDVFSKTLKQVDMTWSRFEAKKAQLDKVQQELVEKNLHNQQLMQRISELEKHACKNNTRDEFDGTGRLAKKMKFEIQASVDKINKFDELMDITDNENNANRVSQIELNNYVCKKMDVSENPLVVSEYTSQNNKNEAQKVDDERKQNGMNYVLLYPDENPATFNYETVSKNDADEKVREGTKKLKHNEYDGWALRVWNASSHSRNSVKSLVNFDRLVLYQELSI